MTQVTVFTDADGQQAVYVNGDFYANDMPLDVRQLCKAFGSEPVQIEHYDVSIPREIDWPSRQYDAMQYRVGFGRVHTA